MNINRNRPGLVILLALSMALLAHACDGSDSSSGCYPGELRLCECTSGYPGQQVCSSQERWNDCECYEIGEDTDPGPDSDVDNDVDTDVDVDTDTDTDTDTGSESEVCMPDDAAVCDAEYAACQIACGDDGGAECFDACFADYCECITAIGCDPVDYDCD